MGHSAYSDDKRYLLQGSGVAPPTHRCGSDPSNVIAMSAWDLLIREYITLA